MMDSAWEEILAAVRTAPYPVEVLDADTDRADDCLARLGITTRSWLGAAVAHTGGILVDHGWLRVLGSGTADLPDVLTETDPQSGRLVVAYDVLGGQFVWARTAPGAPPTIHYFGPDTLDWLDLHQGYADWLHTILAGSLTRFYDTLRWPGWETEAAALALDKGIHTWPPLWTTEGKNLSTVSRKAVPITELVSLHHSTARQLG